MGGMHDIRDHHVKKALEEAIGPWRPEKDSRSRRRRILVVVALTAVTVLAFWTLLHFSSPKHAAKRPAAEKSVPIQLVPAPAKP
jgi:hypothetical protein